MPDEALEAAAANAPDADNHDVPEVPAAPVTDDTDTPSASKAWREASAGERTAALEDPIVKETLQLFDGAVVRVRRRLEDAPPTEESEA